MAHTLRGTVGLLLAVTLIPLSLGCLGARARHGLLMRGDWSLEINRTPWLDGRQVVQEDRSEGSCGPSCGPEACEGGPACAAAGSGAACMRPGGGACRGGAAGANDAAQAQANYHNHPRFHPVPTQPVFTPRPYANVPVDAEVTPATSVEMPPVPTPTLAPPEPVPPPRGQPSSSWRPRSGQPTSMAAVQQSWIFAPAEETAIEGPEINPARQLSLSKSSTPSPRANPVR